MEIDESPLPEEIVEHIQSFMNGKDGARTTLLSKSLYNSWSQRPNLDFDERHFGYRHSFPEFTKKTMQRYEDSKLKIDTFTLRITANADNLSRAKELIVWAVKLGAVDIRIEFLYGDRLFVLPDEIFGSETLARLSITGGAVILPRSVEVTRSKLKSIHLSQVIIRDDLFSHLLLRCPSIEKLVCDGHLLSFGNKMLGSRFHKLESLSLDTLRNRDTLFFQDMLLKFPCLKSLSIRNVRNCSNIRISSQSLERISFIEYYRAVTAEFDVPNLRKFHFEGSALSRLTFETSDRDRDWDWESDVHIICIQSSASWLSSFKNLLQSLSISKVSLSVYVKYPSNYACDYPRDEVEPIPTVEHLKIMDHAPNSGLLDGLFLICRPKFVYQHCFAPGNRGLLELLWKKLGDERSENHCIPNPSMHGLEEVNVEVFEMRVSVWRPLPWKALLEALAVPENVPEFRFRLRWRSEAFAL